MNPLAALRGPSAGKVGALLALYFCQGLPFGFQARALPIYLREHGVSLATIGYLQALALPWLLKALWAPAVDRFGSARLGRRRSWILPMQLGMAAAAAVGATLDPVTELTAVLGVVFLMNLFAATQDIAVDGLAIDLLHGEELGPGNAAQVAGYKLGMTTAGGLLVWVSGYYGWPALFLGMALLCLAVFVLTWFIREPAPRAAPGHGPERPRLKEILVRLWAAARLPGGLSLLLVVGTYELGETMVDVMFKPFLVDAGFTRSQLGLWLGTWGMGASIAGSVVGGVVAARFGLFRTLVLASVLRAVSVGAEWALTASVPTPASVIGVSIGEHFCGGLLTTALFAFMMSRVDPRIGATHYTLLASVEVMGKAPAAFFSGVVAEALGYGGTFALGTAICVAFVGLLVLVRPRPLSAADGGASAA